MRMERCPCSFNFSWYALRTVYLDILPGRKMGLLTQILPTLFPVILLFSAKTRHIKRLKVQSRLHSGFVERKAFPIQGREAKWSGYGSQSPEANAQAALSSATEASSDRTLARMTHMLASSSSSASKDARGRVTEMPRELVT